MEAPLPALPPARSTFISVLAWIFIVFTGFTTLIAILQNVMVALFFPVEEMQHAMRSAPHDGQVPAFLSFMLGHIQLFFAGFLLLTASLFTTSVALLKRKNWARLAFMGFMGLAIAWNIVGLVLQVFFVTTLSPVGAPVEFQAHVKIITSIILIVSSIMAIGMSVLFGWIIKRLASPAIKAEFQRPAPEEKSAGYATENPDAT